TCGQPTGELGHKLPYLGLILPLAQVEMNHKGLSSQRTGTPRDFEFLYGEWMVQGTRRRAPLDGGEWETIEAVHRCWPVLNGLGNVGELVSDDGEPLYACLRYFDARYARWTLYSVSLADGIAMPPMHGGFAGGVGEFRCEDQDRKSTRLNSSHVKISYAVYSL